MKENKAKSKDTYYFSHDANALSDPKILSMRCDYGLEGYGLYWAIIEMLRNETTYRLSLDKTTYRAIQMQAHPINIDVQEFIDNCINEYKESSQGNGLFNTDGTYFWSESLLSRMSKMEEVREKRSEAGKKSAEKRWGKKQEKKRIIKRPKINQKITGVKKFITSVTEKNNNAMPTLKEVITKNNKINENKINESKVNNNKEIKLNKMKLNNLFIYMINGQKNEDSDKITEIDRQAIICILKRIGIYIESLNVLQLFTDEKILEYELQYWTIKEIYFSPYKIYLNSLKRTKFLLKYLQTEKYIKVDSESKITDFINYFIKILRDDFEKGESNNAESM